MSVSFVASNVFTFRFAEKDPSVVRQFTIITGRGRHSRHAFEPVLRPVAQGMLLEEFDPPIPTQFDPTNDGRLQVRKGASMIAYSSLRVYMCGVLSLLAARVRGLIFTMLPWFVCPRKVRLERKTRLHVHIAVRFSMHARRARLVPTPQYSRKG